MPLALTLAMLSGFVNDLRLAARALMRHPTLGGIAVATLALAIGANTAIFSVVDAVLLRPLTYPHPDRLYTIHERVPGLDQAPPVIPVNAMHFETWRKETRSFEQMALLGGLRFNLNGLGEPRRLAGARVSPSLFPMLGVKAQLGRTFLPDEDQPGHDRVVVVDHGFWVRELAADPGALGRRLLLDGTSYEIVGVLPPDFLFPKLSDLYAMTVAEERPEIWKPFALTDDERGQMGDFNYACIARLRDGVTPSRALAELERAEARIAKAAPFKVELHAKLVPLQQQITGRARQGLQLLLAAVGVVLLIGCVNIANLLLARVQDRRREIAIRSALGASRTRLVRQVLAESLLLSALGGALGVAVAYWALPAILARAPVELPRLDEVRLDGHVLLFTALVSGLAGLLCGLLPAWRFSRSDPQEAMKSGTRRTTAGAGSARLRGLLVGAETALGAVGLISGGLLLHSFVKVMSVDRGFEARQLVTVDLSLPDLRYPDLAARSAFVRSLVERVAVVPGVVSAGISNWLPLSGEGGNNLVNPEGRDVPPMQRPIADIRRVSPDYFRTLGITLRRGRVFDLADRDRRLAVVSANTAERLWPGADAVGKRLRIGDDDSPLVEVVGIVGDVRGVSLSRPPALTVYVPYWQGLFSGAVSLAVKTAGDPRAAAGAVRSAVRQLDPDLPVPSPRTMQSVVADSVAPRRFQMSLVLLLAGVATLLASLGIYGVVAYSVGQRTNELGIRLALGAPVGRITRMVVEQGLRPVAAGLTVGVVASMALGRVLGSLLFGVEAGDPLTVVAVVALLGAVALAATWLPARRATRVDPVAALRYE
jgi:predicted permease